MSALRKLITWGTGIGLVTAFVVLTLNALAVFRSTQQMYASAEWVEHTHRVLRELTALQADLATAESSQLAYRLTGDDAFRPRFEAAVARAEADVRRVQDWTVDNPRQQDQVVQLQARVAERIAALRANLKQGSPPEAAVRGQAQSEAILRVIAAMEEEEHRLLADRTAETAASYRRTNLTFAVTSVVTALVLVGAFYLIRRDLRHREQRVAYYLQQKKAEDALRLSEERSRLLLESTGEGIYGIDAAGRCTFINTAGARMLGYEPAELLGQDMHRLVHHTRPDGTPYPLEECPIYKASRARKRGVRVDSEVLWRKDGTAFPAEYSSNPVREDGETLGAVITFNDITARKRAETRLREQEEHFRSLANTIPQLAWMVDEQGDIVWYNQRWYDYTGTTFEEMKGWGWQKVHDPAELPRVVERFKAALASGTPWEDTFPLRSRTGEYRWFLSRAVPIRGADGRVERWFGTNTDVEDQRRAERDLAEAKEAAEAANRAKSTFLANMSHELRTPLNAVILYSELLQEEAEDRGLDGFLPDLEKIRAAGKHLLGLINDILDLSKIEAGKMALFLETFEVPAAVREVAATIGPLVQKRGNALQVHVEPGVGAMHADQTKVRQILFNLLSNAAKFTEKGTITLAVAPAAVDGRAGLTFAVRDTGIGMTAAQVAKLFQPFTQADVSTTRKYGGTGLGLAIIKRFCEMMGGRIDVVSEPAHGTTFTVWLPAEAATAVPAAPAAPTEAAEERTGGAAVLVIDDDANGRELLRRVLSREGFRVRTAPDGRSGLEAAAADPPDVILLDVVMPRMDGWAVLGALKADPKLADIPVVLHTMVDDRNLGYALGAADYLTKPVERDRLVGVLTRFRGRRAAGPVLVIEDDAATQEAVRRALEAEGWQVREAGNGREGLERMTQAKPAAVLLDLMMPEMDGFDFLDEVRKHPDWHDVPVIVLTAKDLSPEDRARLNGRIDQVLQKGAYGRDELLREVRRLVAARARRPRRVAAEPAAAQAAGTPA